MGSISLVQGPIQIFSNKLKQKTLPASGGEGGPDDREEIVGAIRTWGIAVDPGQAAAGLPSGPKRWTLPSIGLTETVSPALYFVVPFSRTVIGSSMPTSI